ncbi:MAG: GH3 auxin-responsive promoter family protein [Muribaculaceae bacterium]|nr:GH3 auxin-responsive promoter family protein [Muribaculaceae bacterium]
MLNFTPLVRPFFERRARLTAGIATPADTEREQRRVLESLLKAAAGTEVGRRYAFAPGMAYRDYADAAPVTEYESIRPDVMRMVAGERDVLWPGRCRRFAQSSGTSGGKSKYIPLTDACLHRNHYRGGVECVGAYLARHPHSRLFGGKSLILGGSFANELADVPADVCVGDLSATLIDRINPAINLFRVPSKDIALMPDWSRKLPAIAKAAIGQDVTNISGVPSWFMTVLRTILEMTGKSTINEVWPNLEVFFHGGIAFGPYRNQYDEIIDRKRMHYMETYNASEGFFALQDSRETHAMRLILDAGVFYEFVPLEQFGRPGAVALPAWEVQPGHSYALVISSCNGLWRYIIGDTVRVESVEPLRITIAGRTSSFINAFGEELMVWNADRAIAAACARTGAAIANYTAAPVYAACGTKGHHQWLVEWATPPACGNEAFADILDAELQAVNSDYQAKRTGGIFLARLELTEAPKGTFNRWLGATGKLGGQRKIPRLANDRRIIDRILASMK